MSATKANEETNMIKKWKYTVSKNGRHQVSQIGGGNICMVWNCKEKEANAHLIAAAPEMYKMLERLSAKTWDASEEEEIENLLAKARGEK